ncbi:hypothetical protein [Rufibacter sp. LB8]|uniref:hypothetical protein n=1 Tax=Rufibacter sp. LB8 TaxID=2777781 RepID=UPI00178C24CB|nr:hypothetical protein [Rufibacter sp. LB8]
MVDFTEKSDAEVVKWLSAQKGETCGKFHDSQLNRGLSQTWGKPKTWAFRALLIGAVSFFTAKSAAAQQQKPLKEDIELLPSRNFSASLATSVPNSQYVSGMVLAQAPGQKTVITVRLNDSLETQADAEGRFAIPIPKSIPQEKQWLVISAIGFKTQRHRLSELMEKQPIQIAMVSEAFRIEGLQGRLGGLVAIYPWYSYYGMKQRLRNLFR